MTAKTDTPELLGELLTSSKDPVHSISFHQQWTIDESGSNIETKVTAVTGELRWCHYKGEACDIRQADTHHNDCHKLLSRGLGSNNI